MGFKTKRYSNVKPDLLRLLRKTVLIIKKTFLPVSKKDSLRIFTVLIVHYDLELHQIDVKIIFPDENLEEVVYMDQPSGRKGKEHIS